MKENRDIRNRYAPVKNMFVGPHPPLPSVKYTPMLLQIRTDLRNYQNQGKKTLKSSMAVFSRAVFLMHLFKKRKTIFRMHHVLFRVHRTSHSLKRPVQFLI